MFEWDQPNQLRNWRDRHLDFIDAVLKTYVSRMRG
jgi:hypothetical protein